MPALNGFQFALGDLVIRLEEETDAFRQALLPRYAVFERGGDPDFTVRLRASGANRSGVEGLAGRLLADGVEIGLDGARLMLRSPFLRGEVDLGRRRGELAAPVHRHGVDVLGRALLAAARPEALVVHGALAREDGRAFLCAGPSGSGKSTLAALLGERALCDELVRLDRTATGWRATALPYWHARPGCGALAAVHLLRHAGRDELRALPRRESTRRLAAEIVWPAFSPERVAVALEHLALLLDEVPVRELRFRPTADVWRLVRDPEAA